MPVRLRLKLVVVVIGGGDGPIEDGGHDGDGSIDAARAFRLCRGWTLRGRI